MLKAEDIKDGELPIDQIILGDCLDVLKKFPPNSIDLVVTDPPYNVGFEYGNGYNDKREDYLRLIDLWLKESRRVSKRTVVLIGIANQHKYPQPKWTLAWIKTNGITRTPLTVGNKMCLCTWEPVLWYGESPVEPPFHDTLFYPISNQIAGNYHPCPKPLDLIQKLVQMGSQKGDLILDPFLGSGTTALAAKQLGRHFIGIEVNPDYVKIAVDRLRQEVLSFNCDEKQDKEIS